MRYFLLLLHLIPITLLSQKSSQLQLIDRIEQKYNWLKIPVKNGASKHKVVLKVGGDAVRSFDIELALDRVDWYTYINLNDWKGEMISIYLDTVLDLAVHHKLFQQTAQETYSTDLYQEKHRPQFHFSAKKGWLNDPNGLVYYKGEYHLFFQHNPYGLHWGNMHWGHAVSTDLVHWRELEIALFPDHRGTMFSGSAIVDISNSSGLGTLENPPLLLFYTCAEGTWEQGIAYSLDGRTFQKISEVAIPKIVPGNRDPKVIWHEESKKWILTLYVTEEHEQHAVYFFNSDDLRNWKQISTIRGGRGEDKYLYECPEFYQLKSDSGMAETKWVLSAVDGSYAIGDFDGMMFKPDFERLRGNYGRGYYAAQVFNNTPNDIRIEIGWRHTHTAVDGMTFNQSMSIPMELSMGKRGDMLFVRRNPIAELTQLRKKKHTWQKQIFNSAMNNPFREISFGELEIDIDLLPQDKSLFEINMYGILLSYDQNTEQLRVDGVVNTIPLIDGRLKLHLFIDRVGVEIFAQDGEFYIPINKNTNSHSERLSLKVLNGKVICKKLDVYELSSIW
ncbi:DUF4980 domain-containing protein [Sphingobacterium faecale]|uniref:DUF4980 domain-containing protein n=1 Tax=Sphingobacterium faecale TaxID=2803775 RepID=A0ABS1R385_9SPHI|nr:DUF4980 domain-containing protein [Sphingobacterium faecale]MBL1409157.1 DUF4980 domain-containing protein [Sphingobacterium faecale]